MQPKQILVVDDHDEIRDLLGRYLSQHGYQTHLADGGEQMRAVLDQHAIDLVILDLMMPGEDGLTLCRQLREKSSIPVIMLTALSEETDTIVGLEVGADDYVTKPFNPRVLLARIKAVLRGREQGTPAAAGSDAERIRFDRWSLDLHQRQLEREDGLVVDLSTAEYRLLRVLLDHPRQVLSRDQLMDLTQGREAMPFDRSIDNQISRLRKKVEQDPKQPTLIKTVWGGGYMLTAETTQC
ncbi:response regulator [Ferrimonas marina]|uniref:Two-component system, OmpR family, response regulator n=1 Tax=Ferrimonas marina TaxID=299255 RepID=A0A1M5XYY3_9GAMM|nr:response regulator [Ferrimonas marina]SHI05037.1 two-component system, OmpR family, response regulator [Ferrimonas marina]